MIRETIVPAIPDIRDDNLKDVLRAIKSTIDVREGSIGDPLDQLVTLRDLTDLYLVESGGSTSTLAGGSLPVTPRLPPANGGYNPSTDFTGPPAPTGLRARGGFTNVYLEWDGAPYRNHSYTEIWRATVDELAKAVLVATTAASLYADPAAPDTTYFYWIRFVSKANVTGPYNQTSGTSATTAIDVGATISALSNQIANSQLFIDLGTRISNIETDAYIRQLTSGAFTSKLDQLSAGVASANSQITSLRSVNGTQATQLTELRTASTSTNARVTEVEQTKIGYATLDATGLAFDNNGAITNKAGVDAWNLANPANKATWHVGLPFASAVKQVGISDGTDSLTLEQRFTAQKTTNNGLLGQYSIKIDSAGHVSGFGLSSTLNTATPTSDFGVRADKFWIAPPAVNRATAPAAPADKLFKGYVWVDTSVTPNVTRYWNGSAWTSTPQNLPFVVVAGNSGLINGKTVGPGVYVDTAFIGTATITNAQIADLTADKITAGSLSAALGVSTGKIWGGVAVSTNKDNGTFGQLTQAFGSNNFGTGFFLGDDNGAYKFYVGKPYQNMSWNGSELTVTGNINAISGSFRNVTIFDNNDNIILSSGGVPVSALVGLGPLATATEVEWADIANRPNTLAELDATAKTDLDGKTVTYYQAAAPVGTANDLWFDTDDGNKLYRHNGTTWVAVQDAGIAAAANLATQAQDTADAKITTYYSTTAPATPSTGDLWYNSSTREIKRWSGSAWVISGNYVNNTNQLTDGAGLGSTATWSLITGTGKPADDATQNQVLSGLRVNRPIGQDGDFYYATDTFMLFQKVNGSWIASASVGAPEGTLVNGVPVSTITSAVTNFNSGNDRNSAAISAPVIAGDATALDHTLQTDGSADISFEWAWGGGEASIDGFQVYVYQSSTASAYTFGTNPAAEMVYEVPAAKRAFILFGVAPDRYYTFGVRAYRVVDQDINANGVITSAISKSVANGENPYQPSAQVAFGGNVTGTINGIAAADVNVWSFISGTGKPANNATKNTVTYSATAPSSPTDGDIWVDTSVSPNVIRVRDAGAWKVSSNYTTNTNQLTDGANLGGTATWTGVTGAGKPVDNATRNVIFRQSSAPTFGMTTNDIWFDTDDNATYTYTGSSWVKTGDVTAQNTALGIINQGALATASSVFVGSTVKFADGTVLNTSDFVNKLTKIGTGNISTFIDGAAITNAYIGNLSAAKITSGTIAADRLDATIITGKVANLQAAQIGLAQIDTLRIAGNAVTVPVVVQRNETITGSGATVTLVTATITLPQTAVVFASASAYLSYGQGYVLAENQLFIQGILVATGGGGEGWTNGAMSGALLCSAGTVTVQYKFYGQDNRVNCNNPCVYVIAAMR